jgi:hypothetical protein
MSTPAGFTAFTAANIQDASGTPLAAGSLLIQPTDANNVPITARSGGTGGQMIVSAATFLITAGSIGTGKIVADTALTSPTNISYRITVLDPQSRIPAVYKGVQPTGATFDFDTYTPNVPAQAPYVIGAQGPPGTVGSIGGASGITLIDSATATPYLLTVVNGALTLT